jgi:LemA protein
MSTTVLVVVGLLVVAFAYIFFTQRSFVSLEEKMNNAFSQISVQTKSRWDALVNLFEMTKRYASYEHDTLQDVVASRKGNVTSPEQLAEADKAAGQVLARINAVAEQYPQLKADGVFRDTMAKISSYEENVRLSRMVYNDCVTKFNINVRQWPSSMVASMLHFSKHELLPEDESTSAAPSAADIFKK